MSEQPDLILDEQPLPVEESDDLIRGYKRAKILIDRRQSRDPDPPLLFAGTGFGISYGNEERAICGNAGLEPHLRPHAIPGRPPETTCRCGFWAVSDLSLMRGGEDSWTLDVDLAGDVIAGDDGWRGEWQRVLRVRAPSWCEFCLAGRQMPARYVGCFMDRVIATCGFHPMHVIVPGGLSWLRRKLGGIEVEGVFLTDEAPVSSADIRDVMTAVHDALRDSAQALADRSAEAASAHLPSRLVMSQGHWMCDITSELMTRTPAPVPGQRMVISARATQSGLAICLAAISPGGGSRTVWAQDLLL